MTLIQKNICRKLILITTEYLRFLGDSYSRFVPKLIVSPLLLQNLKTPFQTPLPD